MSAYGYGHPGAMVGYGAGHHFNTAHHQAHVAASERHLEQSTTLAADLRAKEEKEASAVEKRVADEQVRQTFSECIHEEYSIHLMSHVEIRALVLGLVLF
jgi:hypothetical protein